MKKKLEYWEVWVKQKYLQHSIPELVGIYLAYSEKDAIKFIAPEFRHQVYAKKTNSINDTIDY